MAQNITINGVEYTDVPAVDVPKTGGGTARFVDEDSVGHIFTDFAPSDYADGMTTSVGYSFYCKEVAV